MKQEQAERNWPDDPRTVHVRALEPSSRLARHLPERNGLQSLNGLWKVRILQGVPMDFDFIYEDGLDPDFRRIRVPSSLSAHPTDGLERHQRMDLDWSGRETVELGHTPRGKFQAQYLLDFDLDPQLETDTVRLHFEGVSSAFYAWLNGVFIGYSADSSAACAFDVTGHLQPENNRLAVLVLSHSSGSWLEAQREQGDWGLLADVYLEGRPSVSIDDLTVTTDYRPDDDTGEIRVRIQSEKAGIYGLRLYDPSGFCLFEQESEQKDLRFRLQAPDLWSAEHPDLYRLEIDVFDADRTLSETIIQPIGIRKVWIEEGILLLNGSRMMLHGVNYSPARRADGAFATREELIRDIQSMKRNHINAVRTEGRPLMDAFYTLCDEYGLYVMDEAALECRIPPESSQGSAAQPGPAGRMDWRQPLLARTASMYQQHKNHPSILFWSLGRNSGYGDNLIEMSAWLRLNDPGRPVHYESSPSDPPAQAGADCSDFLSLAWSSPAELGSLLERGIDKPLISGAYMFMEGNAMGGLYRYTQLEQYASYQGGFLERFPRLSASGASGPKDSPLLQEIRALFSPVRILPDPEGAQILNSMLFSDTSGLRFFYEQTVEGQLIASGELEVDLQPGTYSHFPIPWQQTQAESVCTVLARSRADACGVPVGHITGFGQMTLGKTEYFYSTAQTLDITRGKSEIGFHFGSTEILFGQQGLLSLRHRGTEWLRSIPGPVFAHAFSDLECRTGFDRSCACWYGASLFNTVRSRRETFDPNGHYATISYQYQLPYPYPASSSCTLSYTLAAPGILGIDLSLDASRSMPDLAVFGMQFELPAECSKYVYYGCGPDENYKDRQEGAALGVFESSARESLSMYARPQECGNRTGVRWLELMGRDGEGLRFSKIGRPFEISVLPCSFEALQSAEHWDDVNLSRSTWVRIASDHKPLGGYDALSGYPSAAAGLRAANSRRLSFFLSFPVDSAPLTDETQPTNPAVADESETPDSKPPAPVMEKADELPAESECLSPDEPAPAVNSLQAQSQPEENTAPSALPADETKQSDGPEPSEISPSA